MPALKIKYVSTSNLVPYAQNARTHDETHVAQIARSIGKFGFTNPILIDGDKGVIAGHGRLLAAQSLGMGEVPAIELSGLSEAQKRAYILADNKIALNAGWDTGILKLELAAISELGEDLTLTGFSDDEIARLMGDKAGLTDPDEVPENVEPVAKPGDVWVMGKHRLVCGDCTDALVVDKALNGVTPHPMVTDPPYGVDYDPDWRNRADRANGKPYGASAIGKVENDSTADWSEAWALFPGDVAYVWHAGNKANIVADSLKASSFDIRAQIIWNKSNFAIGRGHYHAKHEPCWYAVRSGKNGHWHGDRKQTTVWDIPKPSKSETGHSTQKPVECMKRPIENNSSVGQAIYEPFSGSGTTIIAAEMTGRACHAIEINPAYVDIAVKRWENFTGEKAELDGSAN